MGKLITVYFDEPTSEDIPFTKAIIDERQLTFFTDLGATTAPKTDIPDSDQGSGDDDEGKDDEGGD